MGFWKEEYQDNNSEEQSKASQKSKMGLFVETAVTIFAKGSILNFWQGSEYASALCNQLAIS